MQLWGALRRRRAAALLCERFHGMAARYAATMGYDALKGPLRRSSSAKGVADRRAVHSAMTPCKIAGVGLKLGAL
jgi:hypothetical protein